LTLSIVSQSTAKFNFVSKTFAADESVFVSAISAKKYQEYGQKKLKTKGMRNAIPHPANRLENDSTNKFILSNNN